MTWWGLRHRRCLGDFGGPHLPNSRTFAALHLFVLQECSASSSEALIRILSQTLKLSKDDDTVNWGGSRAHLVKNPAVFNSQYMPHIPLTPCPSLFPPSFSMGDAEGGCWWCCNSINLKLWWIQYDFQILSFQGAGLLPRSLGATPKSQAANLCL